MPTSVLSTKEKIMNNSIYLFYNEGFNNTTIRKIAKYSSITHGAIFKHFKSKNHLGIVLLDNYLENVYKLAQTYFNEKVPLKIKSEYFTLLYFSIHFKLLSNDKKFAQFYCDLFSSAKEDFINALINRSIPIWELTESPLKKTNHAIWQLSALTIANNDISVVDFLIKDKIKFDDAITFVFSTYLNIFYPENKLTIKMKNEFITQYIKPMDLSYIDIYRDFLIIQT
ncbi:TetR family transcriptional regulator [Alkalibaculum sp. M08DMB]|uniref:TetR family transcriptional regulator n=1 Tax=Alkalibaculum sporogenes TaxID=2655001 RepID=A0A6A7K4G8_9FIRM|nr:TetR/AcrR family transcriptional regulator [Alkalibaculum sporogenes]MPW24356.1 TetR family transcriptional regulator [Alkalibaculum sporogenes]